MEGGHVPVAPPSPSTSVAVSERGNGCCRVRSVDQLPSLPGLFVSAALGARGVLYSHFAAHVLAAEMCGESHSGMEHFRSDLVRAVHPARFLLRDLKRMTTEEALNKYS